MGNVIKIDGIENVLLRAAAQSLDNDKIGNKNGYVDGKELSIFKNVATQLKIDGDVTEDDINTLFGAKISKKDYNTKVRTTVQYLKDNVLELAVIEGGNDKEAIKNLLTEKFGVNKDDATYKSILNEVDAILDIINKANSSSLLDLNKNYYDLKKDIRKAGLNMDLYNQLMDMTEQQIRQDATHYVQGKFYDLREANPGKTNEEIMNMVKSELKEEGKYPKAVSTSRTDRNGNEYVKNQEYRDAFINFEKNELATEAIVSVSETFDNESVNGRKAGKVKRQSRKALGENGDKYTDRATAWYKNEPVINSEAIDNNVAKKTADRTEQSLKNDLWRYGNGNYSTKRNNEILQSLKDAGLINKNENGTYDLTELSNLIKEFIGADNTVDTHNKESYQLSETLKNRSAIAIRTIENLTDDEVIALIKTCGFKVDNNHSRLVEGFKNFFKGLVGGVVADQTTTAVHPVNFEFTQTNVNKTTIDTLKESFGAENVIVNGSKVEVKINTTLALNNFEKLISTTPVVGVKAGLITAALGLLGKAPAKCEHSVTSIVMKTCDDIETYAKEIKIENPEYKTALVLLAGTFSDKTGKIDVEAYENCLNNMAGKEGFLSSDELKVGITNRLKEIKGEKVEDTTPNKEETPVTPPAKTQPDVIKVESKTEELTFRYEVKHAQRWEDIVRAKYPCLVEEYGVWGKDGAIKRLQRAMCTDENGEFNEAKFKELISKQDLSKVMDLPKVVDGCKAEIEAEVRKATQDELKINGKYGDGSKLERAGIKQEKTTWTATTKIGDKEYTTPEHRNWMSAVEGVVFGTGGKYEISTNGGNPEEIILRRP